MDCDVTAPSNFGKQPLYPLHAQFLQQARPEAAAFSEER